MAISLNASSPALNALLTLKLGSPDGSRLEAKVPATTYVEAPPVQHHSTVKTSTSTSGAAALQTMMDGLNRSAKVTDAGSAAGASIDDLLQQIGRLAGEAGQSGQLSASRTTLDGKLSTLLATIGTALKAAGVNGQNLVDGSPIGVRGTSLAPENLALGGPIVSLPANASVGTTEEAVRVRAQSQQSISSVRAAVARLKSQAEQIAGRGDAMTQQGMGASAAAGVDTEPSDDGVRLMALQVQQALKGPSASITSSGSQNILALFKPGAG